MGFEKRKADPDFAKIQARLREAVRNNSEFAKKVDSDERAFCTNYDRIAAQTRAERLALHEAPRRSPLPTQAEPSAEEVRRASLLERVRTGSMDDAAAYLTFLETTRKED